MQLRVNRKILPSFDSEAVVILSILQTEIDAVVSALSLIVIARRKLQMPCVGNPVPASPACIRIDIVGPLITQAFGGLG